MYFNKTPILIQFASFEYLQFNDLVTKLRREDEAKWKAAFVSIKNKVL